MRCPICFNPVEDDQPSVEIPDLAGGGRAHRGCWDQVRPFARRLLDEHGLKDYTGLVGETNGEEA